MLEVNRRVRYDSLGKSPQAATSNDRQPKQRHQLEHCLAGSVRVSTRRQKFPPRTRKPGAAASASRPTAIAPSKGTQQQMLDRNASFQWGGTKPLMLIILALWLLFAVAVQLFVVSLKGIIIPYLELPLGFLIVVQGALMAFVVMAFVFARTQDPIERDRAGG